MYQVAAGDGSYVISGRQHRALRSSNGQADLETWRALERAALKDLIHGRTIRKPTLGEEYPPMAGKWGSP